MNTPPAPFHDNAAQTTFLTQFIQDSNHLGQMATTIENNGFAGDIAGLVQQIQTFETNANAVDQSQGGLYSARFWNELRADGTAGPVPAVGEPADGAPGSGRQSTIPAMMLRPAATTAGGSRCSRSGSVAAMAGTITLLDPETLRRFGSVDPVPHGDRP